jgi:hypothetical protein
MFIFQFGTLALIVVIAYTTDSSIPKLATDWAAWLAFHLFCWLEEASKERVFVATRESENVREAFRRMFRMRMRWVLWTAVFGISLFFFKHGALESQRVVWIVDRLSLSIALQSIGTAFLVISAIRGGTAIARDTTGTLFSHRGTHQTRLDVKKHYCERLLAVSAFSIDGPVGFVLLLCGFISPV